MAHDCVKNRVNDLSRKKIIFILFWWKLKANDNYIRGKPISRRAHVIDRVSVQSLRLRYVMPVSSSRRSPIYEISRHHRSRPVERRRVMLWHIGHSLVSVSPHIYATHIRGSGQFSGLSLPVGRKTHLDPSWVTPLRPWSSFLDKLTTIIPPSLFVSPICSLILGRANPSPIPIAFLSLEGRDLLVEFFSPSLFFPYSPSTLAFPGNSVTVLFTGRSYE